MQIEYDKRYPVAATPEQAWAVLADVRATAACWPGAVLATQLDTRRYQGTMGLQLGADAVRLDGGIELLGMDAARRELRLRAQGRDAMGSAVSADLTARVEAGDVPGASALVGRASLTLEGPLAARDRHQLTSTGDRLLAQFAESFRVAAAAVPAPSALRGADAGRHAGRMSSAGADSTLTLMVQAGQAPGAAFAAQDGGEAQRSAPGARRTPGGLRGWLARMLGKGR